MNDYLSTREAAISLNMPVSSFMSLIYKSKIAATRRGRFWFVHVREVERIRKKRSDA